MDLLKRLSETPGAPGREERVRDLIRKELESICDDIRVDSLGTMVCRRRSDQPDAKRVMVSCHMDEIAFYVRSIDELGFARVKDVGGFDTRNLFARQVMIQGRRDVTGTMNPALVPIHLADAEALKRIPKVEDFYVDTGLPVDEVNDVIRIGDPVTLIQTFRTLHGDLVTGKCMDNRAACWVGINTLKALTDPAYDVHVAFTVQEEVGVRGARTCAYSLNPDIGIAIDVTLALDVPGTKKEDAITRLGDGVAIKVLDRGSISDRGLVEAMIDLGETRDIKHQLELLPFGATDAAGIQLAQAGVRVITLSVPCRYVHTVTETINKNDLQGCVDLLVAFLETSPDA